VIALVGERNREVRAFLDGVPSQAGVVLAGLILMIGDRNFSTRELAGIGLITAIATTFIIWKAGHAYNRAILDIIRQGRINIFSREFHADAATIHAALGELQNSDPVVRRISCEILSRASPPSATPALVEVLRDQDSDVRVAALKALSNLQPSPAISDIMAMLADPVPAVRAKAVDTFQSMFPLPSGLNTQLTSLLDDIDLTVRVRAMVALSRIDPTFSAINRIQEICLAGDENQCVLALNALGEIGGPEAYAILRSWLESEASSISIRYAAASALGNFGIQAIPILMKTLACTPVAIQMSAACALAQIGEPAVNEIIKGLENPTIEAGALMALSRMPGRMETGQIRAFAQRRILSSIRYQDMHLALMDVDNDRVQLLADSLGYRARQDSIHSLLALCLLNDRDTITTAIDSLRSGSSLQTAYALESLESIQEAALVRPSLRVWESIRNPHPTMDKEEVIRLLKNEKDDWLRSCANFASTIYSKESAMEIPSTLSIMERVVVLRHVPLLAVLPPMDLQRVAEITKEQAFLEGEPVCAEGEPGDELYVIISGNVRVVVADEGQTEREIAQRGAGEVVGEMSIISGETRMASVIAQNEVHALSLDRLSFESLLRERPEVSLALMRHLYHRLRGSG
jgi:HEAT repeat protein